MAGNSERPLPVSASRRPAMDVIVEAARTAGKTSLRLSLAEVARNSYEDGNTANQAL